MEASAMKAIILLTIVGSCMSALAPLDPLFYSNLIAQRAEFPIQRLDVATTTAARNPAQGFIVYSVPQVNTDVRTIPTAVFSNGRPAIAHIPTTYNFYGTPIYDFRFPFNPMSPPGSRTPNPGYVPRPETPQPPYDSSDDDDGIEKLDAKVEPANDPLGEAAGAANDSVEAFEEEDDSVSVDAA